MGQDAGPPGAPNHTAAQTIPTRPGDVTTIDPTLKGNDNFEVQQALNSALGFLADAKNSQRAIERLPGWLHTLMGEKRFDEIEDFTVAIINAHPTDLRLIELCQQIRIRAKLLQHKPQEALPLAKGLYDVCAMPNTSKAIQLIAECLYDISADGDPAGAVKRFKLEQIQGATIGRATNRDANNRDAALGGRHQYIEPDTDRSQTVRHRTRTRGLGRRRLDCPDGQGKSPPACRSDEGREQSI
jgi:hypothetical protein